MIAPAVSADPLPAAFTDPLPAGPITDQAAEAIAALLWEAAQDEPEPAKEGQRDG